MAAKGARGDPILDSGCRVKACMGEGGAEESKFLSEPPERLRAKVNW